MGPYDRCKWSYNPYKWPYTCVTGVITPISGVMTLLTTGVFGPALNDISWYIEVSLSTINQTATASSKLCMLDFTVQPWPNHIFIGTKVDSSTQKGVSKQGPKMTRSQDLYHMSYVCKYICRYIEVCHFQLVWPTFTHPLVLNHFHVTMRVFPNNSHISVRFPWHLQCVSHYIFNWVSIQALVI